jgi:hypothetical protein
MGSCLPATGLTGLQVLAHASVRDADGRLEVYARAVGDGLHSRTQGYPGGPFLPAWTSLGVKVTSPPAAILDAADRLTLFARSKDGQLWCTRKTQPGGDRLGGWVSMAGWIDAPTVSRDDDGKITVCGIGADSHVWATTQRNPGSGQWLPWVRVGGRVGSRPSLAGSTLFVRSPEGATEIHTLGPGGWAHVTTLGGSIEGSPAGATMANGRLTVFARGSNQGIWQAVEQGPGSWSPWQQLGYHASLGKDDQGNAVFGGDPLPLRNADGRLEVIVRAGADKDLWHIIESIPGYGWGNWKPLGVLSTQPAPSADATTDGRLSLFHRDPSLTLSYSTQSRPGVW